MILQTTQKTQKLENMQLSDVANQTLPPKRLQPQDSGIARERFLEIQSGIRLVPFHNSSKNYPNETQETDNHTGPVVERDYNFSLTQ